MIATVSSCIILLFRGFDRRKLVKLLAISFLVPAIAFIGASSGYALGYLFKGGITEAGDRSRDSISQVYVDVDLPVTGTGTRSRVRVHP